jgi:hypothetical protein
MAEATDAQMQRYANERIRVRAEQARAFVAALRDDKAAIDDVYARAVSATPWTDARTDGPPRLLNQQDVLTFNSVADLLLKCIDGTATSQNVADLHANWAVFQAACVRPAGQ